MRIYVALFMTMTTSEYPPTDPYPYEINRQLFETNQYSGIVYSNIILDGPGLMSQHDPKIVIDTHAIIGVWPGGSPAGNRYESTIIHGKQPLSDSEEVIVQRQALLGATVSAEALARIPDEYIQTQKRLPNSLLGHPPILFAETRARMLAAPLGLILSSTIAESSVAERGDRTMHMWYPVDISAKSVLAYMKRSLKRTIAEETI